MTNDTLASRAGLETLRLQPENLVLAEAVRAWLDSGDAGSLRSVFQDHHEADVAQVLAALRPQDTLEALRLLEIDVRATLFGYLPPKIQTAVARHMSRRELADIVSAMSHDERADLFKKLDEKERKTLLPALAQAEREDLRKLASYPEGTAGSVMTSDYAALTPDLEVSKALSELRIQAPDSETIYQVFVVDGERRLLGAVSLRDLLLARPGERVGDLMTTTVPRIAADQPREEAARLIARYDLMALPVTDDAGKLVGIVTHDDAMDVQAEEATEDFHRVGTVRNLDASVSEASIFMLYRARIAWLVLLVFGNVFSGLGIAYFEDTIAAHVVLVFFLPLLIGSGGNAGSQSATLMVRALATGDVRFSDWGFVIGREVLVAGLLGFTMALAVSPLGLLRGGVDVALVVAAAMVLIVLMGGLIGISLPFILARFGLDSATASGPLVTSIADAAGVVIYFSIATAVLPFAVTS
ncbi:magnesium transporter [Hyphomicrobium nitrativorans NL23]|jgi:magnesium transporter|uniref:Magnesium transporter MgtE n=1 Tax=Hyphomicrobium nitrativorans NL23 TaxID=1029756 RepID=V5SD62_9HYPH|nr:MULTISPECIES: magnesium transporter [Hyphomicrobium]AHB47889.1 magnesium transporter [Hyphomicrobium nitrativorans NL23]HRN88999.1 magnesium transporter [Hyphomicrobium sp.]HRQ27514.1 magnesium transporter [Hyphomicrobium sp.]